MRPTPKPVPSTLVRWILFLFFSALTGFQTASAAENYISQRPPAAQRKFHSDAVEQVITRVKSSIADPKLAWMFENCYPNTLDTTVDFGTRDGKPDTFIITGDINAMWLRDSSAQVEGYLSLCRKDAHLAAMIVGLIHRQSACILLDPYANAFYKDGSRVSNWHSDHTLMKPGVHERKWELDSLCYCIRLDYQYWKVTGDLSVFDDEWNRAMHVVVATMIDQQRKDGHGSYCFMRDNGGELNRRANGGYGAPFKPVGMICSAFRNSDDATTYLFNIPDNLFAVVSLRQLAEMLDALSDRSGLAARSRGLADEVEAAVNHYGIIEDPWGDGKMYVYECDGLGHYLLIDDAGIPSLTSLPYLGCVSLQSRVYQDTRRFAQSPHNPLFYRGTAAEGTGSTHIPGRNIWPMGIIGRALTSSENSEILHCLAMLEVSQANTGFMHESFNADNPRRFTRRWFAWVNNLFGVLVLKVERERPQLLGIPPGK